MNNRSQRTGILFLLSAPSGAGKTTLCSTLRETESFVYAVSCTTRAPRPGEVDGEHYHFLTEDKFVSLIEEGAFHEHAHVHGRRYGKDIALVALLLLHLADPDVPAGHDLLPVDGLFRLGHQEGEVLEGTDLERH